MGAANFGRSPFQALTYNMVRSILSLTNTGAFVGIVLINAAGTSVQLRQTITSDGLVVSSGNSHNDEFMQMPTRTLEGREQTRTCRRNPY